MHLKTLHRVGILGKTHGVNGYIRLYPDVEWSNITSGLNQVFIGNTESNSRLFYVDDAKFVGDKLLIHFEGLNSPERVKSIVNHSLFVIASDFVEIKQTESVNSFIGYRIQVKGQSQILGTVSDIMDSKAHRTLVVVNDEKEYLIPFVEHWIMNIDEDQLLIIMDLPEGLVDNEN